MEPLVIVAIVCCVLIAGLMYGAWRAMQPKHLFIARDLNLRTAQPYRLKTLQGKFKVKNGAKNIVEFTVMPGYEQPRWDGKGVIVEGDINTGELLKPTKKGNFIGPHGVFSSAAHADGRVDLLVRSTKGTGITLHHILIGLAIVGGLVVVVIYQFARGSGQA